ncbi:MAG: hypothetical protein WD534_06360 [Phycisphaeraceae bacterium]
MPDAHLILCGGVARPGAGDGRRGPRPIRLDAREEGNVRLRISDITKPMTANLPPIAADLLNVATYIYCADQSISRGHPNQFNYREWNRRLHFVIPVNHPQVWNQPAVMEALVSTLSFLSDDNYEFQFVQDPDPEPFPSFLEFLECQNAIEPEIDEVVLFSGGLDSLAGAIKELKTDRHRVALVSHRSAPKLHGRQRRLVDLLTDELPSDTPRPFPIQVWINKKETLTKDYAQRARSFLFASLAAVVARLFDRDRVRFYENGVISFNLSLSSQAIGGRATRTTHPRTLDGFGQLFSLLFDRQMVVENPFLWKTKTDVITEIMDAGCAHLCPVTVSCAHTIKSSHEKPHCGHCSQCVDRRLSALAAGLSPEHDPVEGYRKDIWRQTLDPATDRTLAESYIRLCTELEKIDDVIDFATRFPEACRAYRYLNESHDEAAERILKLYKRHATQINGALDRMGADLAPELRRGAIPPYSLGGILFLANVSYERDRAPALVTAGSSHRDMPGVRKRKRGKSGTTTERALRPSVAAAIAKLEAEMSAHLKSAKDHAYETGARGNCRLLPRPLQKQLAKQTGLHVSTVTRCLKHPHARMLKILWNAALDLDQVKHFKG